MKIKPVLWLLSVLLGGMAWSASAQITVDNGSVNPGRAGAVTDGMRAADLGARPSGLTFEERVAYQRAIEAVYWRHRIWPKENPQSKPSLDEVMPEAALRAKVEDYLRQSQVLAEYGQRPITAAQLQAEMERQARQTQQPERLRELWAALGNDPYVIAECLARPALANHLIRTWYAADERYSAERKEGLAAWWAGVRGRFSGAVEGRRASYRLPAISAGSSGCVDNAWTAVPLPTAQGYHTAVWTGTEMIVWGGYGDSGPSLTGGRYNPATDTWTATRTVNAPSARYGHTAVWTGMKMIVWGGYDSSGLVDTGGRYDPATDTWTAIRTVNAPSARAYHTAVWTGTEMIVWGGGIRGSTFNTGGRYDPATDTWTATRTVNAPSARWTHTAVWTGTKMIVWGGDDGSDVSLNTGGRYDPAMDTWTATSTVNAPSSRAGYTAVWTGTEMIVWGGQISLGNYLNTGGRYDPTMDTWAVTSTVNAPSPRSRHTAVWTGTEMIVWGGTSPGFVLTTLNTGGRYDPATDTWTATRMGNAPSGRASYTAVWTGTEMIVWGGCCPLTNTGGRYDPATDTWTAISTDGAPSARYGHMAVWTGTEMIIWGGSSSSSPYVTNTGGRYDPATDTWRATNTVSAPSARSGHTAVWTGMEMIVWGGISGSFPYTHYNTGGRYDPASDTWTAISLDGAPSGRAYHTAVWTGTEMIVWGGTSDSTGGRYDPASNTWAVTSTVSAPSARSGHTAVWTGTEMIVWGGGGDLNTGGRYDPAMDTWTAISTVSAPSARAFHTAVWTGTEMIVWGGNSISSGVLNTGSRYDPDTDTWAAVSTDGAPRARYDHKAVWTGTEMIVWGGRSGPFPTLTYFNTGGRYCASAGLPIASMTGEQVVPPVQTSSYAVSAFVPTEDRSALVWILYVQDLDPATITEAHVHVGPAGQNGPILFRMTPLAFDQGVAYGVWTAGDLEPGGGITTLAQAIAALRTGRCYSDVHTRTQPEGLVRGQINLVR